MLISDTKESKPGFPLSPEQRPLGPLVLDAEKKIQVPAAINTYLRDYQREGAAFFYKHYDKDMGGLLGDDMGLVSILFLIFYKLARTMLMLFSRVSWIQDCLIGSPLTSSCREDHSGYLFSLCHHEEDRHRSWHR